MTDLVFIIAWFVLPLIPAFLLFKYLPSTGGVSTQKARKAKEEKVNEENMVKGPLNGLAIKFGGAFAGYLVLFLLAKGVLNDRMKKPDTPKDLREVWTIKGSFVAADSQYNTQKENPEIKIDPVPLQPSFGNGTFELKVVATDDGNGYLDFPNLYFTTNSYSSATFRDLDFTRPACKIDACYDLNNKSHIINLKDPLVLHLKASLLPSLPDEVLLVDTARVTEYQ